MAPSDMLAALYRPAPFAEPLPPEEARRRYPRLRWRMMGTIFTGYVGYYIVRQNFAFAKLYLIRELHMTTGDVGLIATALTIAYGISKFVMGSVSDRANPRWFLATGLILSGVVNLGFGFLPAWAMICAWFVNGWLQGMGWAPCARTLTHWFSDRERGTKFAIWNVATNVGGGITGPLIHLSMLIFASWTCVFYAPGILAILMGLLVIAFLRDTPQSMGLPPIEEYADDYPDTGVADRERELPAREVFRDFILPNRALWALALANAFVYVVRYGVFNWAPTYLTAVKHSSDAAAFWQSSGFEVAAIPGTLLAGWLSDRYFQGRRAPVAVGYMLLVTAAVLVYWLNPAGRPWVDTASLATIGFLIYGPVMLIGVASVDLVPKKAAGTAAGLTGMFGYVGGATIAELGIGKVVQHYGWDGGFKLVLAACLLAILLLAFTWRVHDRRIRS